MIMKSGAKCADNFLDHWKWSTFPPAKSMANDDFFEAPRRADSKNPISIFFLRNFRSGPPPEPGGQSR